MSKKNKQRRRSNNSASTTEPPAPLPTNADDKSPLDGQARPLAAEANADAADPPAHPTLHTASDPPEDNQSGFLLLAQTANNQADVIANAKRSRPSARGWRWAAKRLPLVAALAALVFGGPQAFVAMKAIRTEKLQRAGESSRLMNEAWDILSGGEGARFLHRPVTDTSKLELVRRKLVRVQEIDHHADLLDLYWGFYYYGMRLYPEALQSFRASAANPAAAGMAYLAMAATLKDLERPDEAIEAGHRALEQISGEGVSATHNLLGLLLVGKGSQEAATSEFQAAIAGRPSFPDSYLNLARLYFASGKHAEAIMVIRSAMRTPLDPPDSVLDFIPLLLNMHSYVEAVAITDRVLANDPRNTKGLITKALALLGQKKPDESIIASKAALALNPHLGEAYLDLASAYQLQGKNSEAKEALQAAIREDPLDPLAHFNLGQNLAATNQDDAAIIEYRSAITLAPRFAPAHFYLSKVLERKGEARMSADEYERARGLGMRSSTLNHVFERGLSYRCRHIANDERILRAPGDGTALTLLPSPDDEKMEQPHPTVAAEQDSEKLAREARVLISGSESRFNGLGDLPETPKRRSDLELAKRKLDTALEKDPGNAEASKTLGDYYLDAGDLTKARQYFERALALDPNGTGGMAALAVTLEKLGDFPSAEIYLQEATEALPTDSNAYTEFGMLRQEEGRLEEAKALFNKAVQLEPQNYIAWHDLGIILDMSGDSLGAESAFRRAIKIQPSFASSHRSLAIVLISRGLQRMDDALAEAQKATTLRPDHSKNWSWLATVLRKSSFGSEAYVAARKSLELDPEDVQALRLLKDIEKDLPSTPLAKSPEDQQVLLQRALNIRFTPGHE